MAENDQGLRPLNVLRLKMAEIPERPRESKRLTSTQKSGAREQDES